MSWLPENADFLSVLGGVLAIGTGVLGLLISAGQLSGSTRAHRRIKWTSRALEAENDPARKVILQRIKVNAQGSLLAAIYVPWWRFTEVVVWSLATAVLAGIAANSNDSPTVVVLLLVGFINLTLLARRAIRLYSERVRVAHQFIEGGVAVEPVRTELLGEMEGSTRAEYILGAIAAIAVLGTAGSIAWVIIRVPEEGWMALLILLGLYLCIVWGQVIRGYAHRRATKIVREG